MIGRVEKDEPMPMVTMRPTSSMTKAAAGLEPANKEVADVTSGSICLVSLRTLAKPCAVIMMSPIRAIIRMPPVKTSSASAMVTTRVAMNSSRPIRAPTRSGSALDSVQVRIVWTTKQARTAISATTTLTGLTSTGPETSSPEPALPPVSIR